MRFSDALTVGRALAGDGTRSFQFYSNDMFVYWNQGRDGKWYFALWMPDGSGMCKDLEIPHPLAKTVCHFSLFKGDMPNEKVAMDVVESLRRALEKLKKDVRNFQCLCTVNEKDSESDYALLDLHVSCRLYVTCHHLVRNAFQDEYYCYSIVRLTSI